MSTDRIKDEPVIYHELNRNPYDYDSYDVEINTICTASKVRPITDIGVADCMVCDG